MQTYRLFLWSRLVVVHFIVVLLAMLNGCDSQPSLESLMADARKYDEAGEHKSAIIQLSNVLKNYPSHTEARYMLGSIYIEDGEMLRAETHLRDAIKQQYAPEKVLPLLAQALFAQGKFQAVLDGTRFSDYGEAAVQPSILSLRGHAQLSLGDFTEAEKTFKQVLELDPDFSQALLGEARLALYKGDLALALEKCNKAVAGDANSLNAWLLKADIERSLNRPDDAAASYKKAFDINPLDVAVNMNMASMAMSAGDIDEARKHIDTIRKHSPDSPVGNYFLGLIEFRQKNYKAADVAVQQVLKRLPNYMPARALSGAIDYYEGNYDKAEKQLRDIVTLYPSNVYFSELLAASLLKAGKAQQSLDVLKPLSENSGNDPRFLALMAEAHYKNGDLFEAKKYFEAASEHNPDDTRVRSGLGLTRLATGETDRALADLESVINDGDGDEGLSLVSSLLTAKQFDTAYDFIVRLEENRQSDNPDIQNIKGTILLARKDLMNARAAFERALELQPDYFPAEMNLASLDIAEKHYQSAQSRYEKIRKKDASNIEVMIGLAKLAMVTGEHQEAVTWLELAKVQQPKAFAPNFILAQMFIDKGEYTKAIDLLRDALSAQPQHPEALYMLGFSQLKVGQAHNAESTYSKLVSAYPDSPQALYGLGVAQATADNKPSAIITLQKAVELQPDFPDAIATLVDLQINAGHIEDAMKLADTAQRLYPKRPLGFLLKGDVYMATDKYPQAVHEYDKAFQLEENADIVKQLHNALSMNGQGDDAEKLLANWLRKHPDDMAVRLYFANAAIKAGSYQQAIDQYEQALQSQPSNLSVMHNIVWCYQQMNDVVKALAYAERAYKANPDAPVGMVDLAGLLLQQGDDSARAVKLLEKARDIAPNVLETRYLLAKAYVKTGESALARKELELLMISRDDYPGREDAIALYQELSK